MKRAVLITMCLVLSLALGSLAAWGAYHHQGESDSGNFLAVYPGLAGTKLDSCALCHTGGSTTNRRGKTITMGSCQWCHTTYGYEGSGNIVDTLNDYGKAYWLKGRNQQAVRAIASQDSDGDGYSNQVEIEAVRYPGDASDDPSKQPAPCRVYTLGQIKALGAHTQFLLMNTTRSGDYYTTYTGITLESLLSDAGILPEADTITAYAPDGYSIDYTIEAEDGSSLYYVKGTYPSAVYYYDTEADQALNPSSGWCDYSASSCQGRKNGDTISVEGGLRMILAYLREGTELEQGVLDNQNRLQGEGPFRVVPPQKVPCPPDQSVTSDNQDVVWPYQSDWDHNAGFSARTVTIIKVSPLPSGTTDIDVMEAGWTKVDLKQVVIYGAIDGTDSNGNGVLDSEEKLDADSDYNGDGIPDYQDPRTARLRHSEGIERVLWDTSLGAFADMRALDPADPAFGGTSLPSGYSAPYGAFAFQVSDLGRGAVPNIKWVLPGELPSGAKVYLYFPGSGWRQITPDSSLGAEGLVLRIADGGAYDSDGAADGKVTVSGIALLVPTS